MGIHAELNVHDAKPIVRRMDRTIWLSIPLSDTGSPAIAFFLSLQAAQALLASLTHAVNGYARLVALEAETEHET